MTRLSTPITTAAGALLVWLTASAWALAAGDGPAQAARWRQQLDDAVVAHYVDPSSVSAAALAPPAGLLSELAEDGRTLLGAAMPDARSLPWRVGALRGRLEQAVTLTMADAVSAGRLEDARAWRAQLSLPRGVSATEGAIMLQALGDRRPDEAARLLVREAITWQTTRARALLDQAQRSAQDQVAMPGRLAERLAEAIALADLPAPLRQAGQVASGPSDLDALHASAASLGPLPWDRVAAAVAPLRRQIESSLPNLLTPEQRQRRQRLLLKLVQLTPKEYIAGVRDGQIVVPLEYRESVTFTAQARQLLGELAPLWLAEDAGDARRADLAQLDALLESADAHIAAIGAPSRLDDILGDAAEILGQSFGVTLQRSGTTADIVDEVMVEVRSLLSSSLAAAQQGQWREAEQLRLEAYTTYDPELEARLMPRDPQLATDIEHLLLDGLDQPGVKMLLDQRVNGRELESAYQRVNDAMAQAAAMLQSAVDPRAAAINAGSILLREGLEGLLVIIALFAGLRGPENATRRKLIWLGVLAAAVATAATYLLSRTVITELRAYGEVIAAVTGVLAIAVLLLITNWLFHQVYWRQWITTLKARAAGESAWQLISVGFFIGYREGFETVLFLQSLVMDAGPGPVGLGVAVGAAVLLALGVAALYVGLRLPYMSILLGTAVLIGVVLLTFVGGTVRAFQTIGWLPVHKILSASWPLWLGQWFGVYNTWESVLGQAAAAGVVLGTWRMARWQAKRKGQQRQAQAARLRQADETPDAPPAEA
jgi:high-affinity iron transporter